jgi:hypothetical protein
MSEMDDLRRLRALGVAAECLYYNHAGFYDIAVPDWKHLPRATRDQWIESAKDAIEGVGPQRPTRWAEYQAGFNSSKVIARITPEAPWGETA